MSHSNDSNTKSLLELDQELIEELSLQLGEQAKYKESATMGRVFRNRKIAEACKALNNLDGLSNLEVMLFEEKTLALNTENVAWQDIDGQKANLLILRAANTSMWPMGTHYWVRDNALIADRLLNLKNNETLKKIGSKLLLSCLTVMSSLSQVKRFKDMVLKKGQERNVATVWPYIFLDITNNLNAAKPEPWMHIQDAWQILAQTTLTSLQASLISMEDITEKHQMFLGAIVPFLIAVSGPTQENAGSWEEICAKRSSVMAWEHCLIESILGCLEDPQFSFLDRGYRAQQSYLREPYNNLTIKEAIVRLSSEYSDAMQAKVLFESAEYKPEDPRYRAADAALLYLLLLGYPDLLADRLNKDRVWARSLEDKIVSQIDTLIDPRTRAIKRYQNDSYQRQGFFRNTTTNALNELYGSPSSDASGIAVFLGRDRIVPDGPEAAWVHFVFQFSAWAGKKFQKTKEKYYYDLQFEKLLDGLALITGESECSIDQLESGKSRLIQVPSFRVPECYLTDFDGETELIFPSPHTPLNWAVAEAIAAMDCMKQTFLLGI